MSINSEGAGVIIAVGFVILGVVGLPIAKWFLIAGIALGVAVAFYFGMSGNVGQETRSR